MNGETWLLIVVDLNQNNLRRDDNDNPAHNNSNNNNQNNHHRLESAADRSRCHFFQFGFQYLGLIVDPAIDSFLLLLEILQDLVDAVFDALRLPELVHVIKFPGIMLLPGRDEYNYFIYFREYEWKVLESSCCLTCEDGDMLSFCWRIIIPFVNRVSLFHNLVH